METYVIATLYPPMVWHEYDTPEEAQEALPKVQDAYPTRHYRAMPADRYSDEERRFYLSGPMAPVSAEEFGEAPSLCSPINHRREGDFERFCLGEILTASFATQYARLGDRHYSKIVDFLDATTWITADHIRALEWPHARVA